MNFCFGDNYVHLGGGTNISWIDKNEDEYGYFSPRLGYNLGINLEFETNNIFAVLAGASLETRGKKYISEHNYYNNSVNNEDMFLYLQFPFFVQLYISEYFTVFEKMEDASNKIRYTFFAGPEFGYNISNKYRINDEEMKLNDLEKIDLGISFGVGLEYNVENIFIFIKTCLYYGLTKIVRELEGYEVDGPKNRNFKIKFGFKIPPKMLKTKTSIQKYEK
jgi:hypothetical protein